MKKIIEYSIYTLFVSFFLFYIILATTGNDIVDIANDIFGYPNGENIVYGALWIVAGSFTVIGLYYVINAILNMFRDL